MSNQADEPSSLKHLDLYISRVAPGGFELLFEACPHLETLSLYNAIARECVGSYQRLGKALRSLGITLKTLRLTTDHYWGEPGRRNGYLGSLGNMDSLQTLVIPFDGLNELIKTKEEGRISRIELVGNLPHNLRSLQINRIPQLIQGALTFQLIRLMRATEFTNLTSIVVDQSCGYYFAEEKMEIGWTVEESTYQIVVLRRDEMGI